MENKGRPFNPLGEVVHLRKRHKGNRLVNISVKWDHTYLIQLSFINISSPASNECWG